MALTYGQLVTQTFEMHLKTMRDNYHTQNRVLERVMGKKQILAGGTSVQQPIRYAATTNAGAINPYANLNITANEKVTKAQFEWATYAATVNLYGYDLAVNQSGPQRVLDMISNEFESASMSLADAVAVDLFTGTGEVAGVKHLVGLQTAVDSAATYGDIAVADCSVWAAGESASMTALDLQTMSTAMRTASDGKDEPNIIITTKTIDGIFESKLTPIQVIQQAQRGEAGFRSCALRGADLYYDNNCPSGEMYLLNEKYIHFGVLKGVDMMQKEKGVPIDLWSQVQTILYAPVFWLSERRRHYKFTAIAS